MSLKKLSPEQLSYTEKKKLGEEITAMAKASKESSQGEETKKQK